MLAQLVLLLPAVGASLRLLGFKRTRGLLERFVPSADPQRPDATTRPESANRIARLVAVAAHHGPYRATCLRQSLALWWLLRRRGIPAELRIGVRKDNEDCQAHAWVERDGQPLNDTQGAAMAYAPFDLPVAAGPQTQP